VSASKPGEQECQYDAQDNGRREREIERQVTAPNREVARQPAEWKAEHHHRPDGGDCETVLREFGAAGVDVDALAAKLQEEGAAAFVRSWGELMKVIASKSAALETVK